MNPAKCALLVAFASLLTFAACGGSKSGGGPTVAAPQQPTPQQPAPAPTVTRADVQGADPERALGAAAEAARSRPNFGSVTQSANRGADGVANDRASATFADDRLRVNVARQGKSALTLDSADAIADESVGPVADPFFGIPGAARTYRSWGTLKATESAATLARIAVVWANDDITSSSGSRGGRFSNLLDTGEPRLVAGTFGGDGATAGGSRAVFVGAFWAGKRPWSRSPARRLRFGRRAGAAFPRPSASNRDNRCPGPDRCETGSLKEGWGSPKLLVWTDSWKENPHAGFRPAPSCYTGRRTG